TRGVVRDLKVLNANISSPPNAVYSWVGVLAGRAYPDASVIGVFVTGIVTGYHGGEVGGLVGGMDGKIDRSAADCSVTGVDNNDGQYRNYAGGLVGLADG